MFFTIEADVLVHCAPKDLQLHTGALSRVLLKDAGPGLQQELSSAAAGGINYGGLVITRGYGLPCKFVFHGALPKWGSLSPNPSGVRLFHLLLFFIVYLKFLAGCVVTNFYTLL